MEDPLSNRSSQAGQARAWPVEVPLTSSNQWAEGTPPNAWVLIELLCTDDAFRGRGVGKLLLAGPFKELWLLVRWLPWRIPR